MSVPFTATAPIFVRSVISVRGKHTPSVEPFERCAQVLERQQRMNSPGDFDDHARFCNAKRLAVLPASASDALLNVVMNSAENDRISFTFCNMPTS